LPVNAYPLGALLELRQSNARKIEQQLASELVAERAARERVDRHEEQRAALQAAILVEARRQHDRTANGQVLAHEVSQTTAYLSSLRSDLERLAHLVSEARIELDRCVAATGTTQHALARARRQLAVIQRHQSRYLQRMQKLQENRMEEDAAEAWQSLHTKHQPKGET
jgi:NCAIR mutase (PurE)-related protein